MLRRGDGVPAIAVGRAQDEDCIRRAWPLARRDYRAAAREVAAIHSEWEPSPYDIRFIRRTFPQIRMTYTFPRPRPGGWQAALAAAAAALANRDRGHEADHPTQSPRPVAVRGELLPLLVSYTSPHRGLLEYVPHHELVPGRLGVALATVAVTPLGTIAVNHLTQAMLDGQSFAELMASACDTLVRGLRITTHTDPRRKKDRILAVHRAGPLATSAIVLPAFYERVAGALGTDQLLVALSDPDTLLVAAADSGWATELVQYTFRSRHPSVELVPTVLSLTWSGIGLVAERPQARRAISTGR